MSTNRTGVFHTTGSQLQQYGCVTLKAMNRGKDSDTCAVHYAERCTTERSFPTQFWYRIGLWLSIMQNTNDQNSEIYVSSIKQMSELYIYILHNK